MIMASEAKLKAKLHERHSVVLNNLNAYITQACNKGLYKIEHVFISHKIKLELVEILKDYGYKVTEESVGNNFTIEWD